jgi:flagellar hook-associated protein 3 FlgL
MRITNGMLADTMITNLNRNLNKLDRIQTQLTSGKRLARPSDEPADVASALTLRSQVAAGKQYLRNIDAAMDWLTASEAALSSTTELAQRVRELTVQGANDTLSPEQRAAMATEVDQLLEQMVAQGNSSLNGQRLFAGFRTNADPFSLAGSTVTYSGDTGQMLREIDAGNTIQINQDGNATFAAAFAAVISIRDHLSANDGASLGSTDLTALDAAMTTLLSARTNVGGRINRLESARSRQELLLSRLTEMLSKIEDTDYASAITELTNQETVYKAALEVGSRAIQPSLLDYLR